MATMKPYFFRHLTFRHFLLLLCGLYLCMVLIFHSHLQFERQIVRVRGNVEKVVTMTPTAQVSDDGTDSLFNQSITGLRKWVSNYYNVKSLAKEINILEKMVEKVKSELILNVDNKVHCGKDCIRMAQDVEDNKFQELEKDVYVYSAYLDDRKPKTYIRMIMLVAKYRRNNFSMFCEFGDGSQVAAKPYEMCENHNMPYGGYIYSCLVSNQTICPMRLRTPRGQRLITVPIIHVAIASQPYEYGICIPPLFGKIEKHVLVEFLELTMLLGAEHFYFYNFSMTKEMAEVLKHYHDRKLVTIIPWNIPTNLRIWYHGQLLAHNDCMYRAMSTMRYMMINDIDEFVIPHGKMKTWNEFVPDLLGHRHCGLAFTSAYYDTALGIGHPSGLLTMSHTVRSQQFSHVRTKVLVQPLRTFEVGIHHISKQNEEKWTPRIVKSEVAYIHHYRKCEPNFGMKCYNTIQDKTVFKYLDELRNNFDWTMTFLESIRNTTTIS